MKILTNDYLSNVPGKMTPTKGGPANFARAFTKSLLGYGHELVSVCITDSEVEFVEGIRANLEGQFNTNQSWWNIEVSKGYFKKSILNARTRVIAEVVAEKLITALEDIIVQEKPEVIFINGFSLHVWCLFKAAQKTNVPVVVQHAGIGHFEIDAYKAYFSAWGIKALNKMEIELAQGATRNIFLNETTRSIFIRQITSLPLEKTVIIPLPLEIKISETDQKDDAKNEFRYIGIVARWDIIKNHKAYLDLAIAAHTRKLPWKFFAVTAIPETKKNIRFKNKYKKYIEVIAPMDKEPLNNFYRKMDLLVLPSHFDVSPTVVLEGAAVGTPTVISPNVGHADLFKQYGAEKFVVDFKDGEQVCSIIERLIGESYPQSLLTILRKIHDPKTVFAEYNAIFTQIK